ncbi:MAG: UvrD-helicase domain-containing protein, partial [Acidothermus cellulolyticus]|nr:UvrD-helicase domain-containing protein [Acidothermus cellulolyticus]
MVATVADTPGGNRHSGRAVPEWDAEQQAVLAHRGGPLLILGGPGTGKTTLLIETVADRVSRGEVALENVLVLTGQRRSAAELRRRIALRLGRTSREPLARTFHSYAFGVLCADAIQRGEPPPRLLTSAEQDVIIRELLRGDLDRGATDWPERLRPALPTRGFARELREFLQQALQRGLTPDDVARLGRQAGRDDWVAIGRFAREYSQVTALRDAAGYDPAELILAATALLQEHPQLLESCR